MNFIQLSIRGGEQDFTQGNITRAVFLLAIPMILEMMMESVFAVVDIFFVGKLGNAAVATVGLVESVSTLIYSVAVGLSMAATAIVARRIGEKDPDAAARSGAQSILVASVISLLVSVAGICRAGDILRMMGAGSAIIQEGTPYARVLFGGNLVIMLLFLINGIFRGAGNAAIAMKSLWLANLLNIILCPMLINGWGPFPQLGLTGAAIATTIGRGTGVLYQCWHLARGKGQLRMKKQYFLPDGALIKSVISIAYTGTLQFLIGSASWILLARLVAGSGEAVLAGYQVSLRILMFFLLPAWGLSNAAATLVGQNLGAQQPKRAEQSVWKAAIINGVFMLLVTAFFRTCGPAIVRFINKDIQAEATAIHALSIVSMGYLFYGVGMVLISALNGAGDTRTPTIINIVGFWLVQIPLAFTLSQHTSLGATGVFIAIPAAESLITVLALVFFMRGKWKLVKV
ncbi:multi antimicrobial extrusion protein (Na(+)/drug antiporter), MATE family of MDR efflux pumps [Filimonas lacunae]|nr:multi antimicrobial extrusion protein (Na(+)/drug antiporter), MATE family of MDR efflux pumps [Filimonas lacunae]